MLNSFKSYTHLKNIGKNYREICFNIFYLVKVMAYFCHHGWAHKVQEGMQAGQVWCSAIYWTTLEWRSFRWQSFWLVGVPERLTINNIWTCFVIITIDWWCPVVINHQAKYGHSRGASSTKRKKIEKNTYFKQVFQIKFFFSRTMATDSATIESLSACLSLAL